MFGYFKSGSSAPADETAEILFSCEEPFHGLHGKIHPIPGVGEGRESVLGVEPPGAFIHDINDDRQRFDGLNVVEGPLQRIREQQVSDPLRVKRGSLARPLISVAGN